MSIPDLQELRLMRNAAAQAALRNDEMLAIFERIDRDCADAEILRSSDPVAILRMQIEQRNRKEAA